MTLTRVRASSTAVRLLPCWNLDTVSDEAIRQSNLSHLLTTPERGPITELLRVDPSKYLLGCVIYETWRLSLRVGVFMRTQINIFALLCPMKTHSGALMKTSTL